MEFLTYELINQKKPQNKKQTNRHDIHYKTVKLKNLLFDQF